ncbi:MAG: hypothetical protein ABI684_14720 [Nitrospirota bacterium]
MGSPVKKEAFEQVYTWLRPTGSAGPSGLLWVQSRGGNRDYRRENFADRSDLIERMV